MGTITNFASLQSAMVNSARSEAFVYNNANVGVLTGIWLSTYVRYGAGSIPTVAAVPNSLSPGALLALPLTSANQFWLVETEFAAFGPTSNTRFNAILYDRLSHMGGLSALVTTEQTTNLPTASLTRYTSGEGVIPCLEGYASATGISTTATIRYTNSAGVANRISQPISVSATSQGIDSLTPFPLQDGDTGCRSVEGLTFAAAGTSAGNFGITLFKKLATMPVDTGSYTERQAYRQMMFHGGVVEILPGAYLQLAWMPSNGNTGNWNMQGRLGVVEA